MTDAIHCPDCGTLLPPDAPQGECPRCLLRAAMQSQLESQPPLAGEGSLGVTRTSSGGGHFVPPTVPELQQRIPQYEILELIGQGGMGAVYKARQRGLERLVAIKILPFEIGPGHTPQQNAAFTERFAREARALALLSHPHIVTVHDFGQADGMCYFVMEYVAGVNLRQAIQAGRMNPAEALAIVPQICEALQYAHDEGVVHRDIKPENILIDTRGRVKIADFGLAKLLGGQTADRSLTGTQQVMGTLRYMAPEQMLGTKEVDHRADIFSLGVVFYELLTGELPIGRFAPPSKKAPVDARLDDVVLRALENEPAERYQHVSEMKTGVDAIVRSPAARPTTQTVASQPVNPPAHPFLGTTWHLLLCFALSLITLWFMLYFGPPVFEMIDGPDLALIEVGDAWMLGRNVQTIFSSLIVIFVGLVAGTALAWWKYRAAGLQQQRDAHALLPVAERTADEAPRLSSAALWGAILAPLFLFTMLAAFGTTVVIDRADSGRAGPPLALRLLALVLLIPGIVGLFSPFATTLLGLLGIAQIRNAKGKLYGMPLAVFDTLAFPLLFLDVLLLGICFWCFTVIFAEVLQLTYNTSLRNWGPALLTVVIVLPAVIALNVWLVRLTWRAAVRGLAGYEPAAATPIQPLLPKEIAQHEIAQSTAPRLSLAALWGALLIPLVLLPIGLFMATALMPVSRPVAIGDNSAGVHVASPTWMIMPVMCVGLPGLIPPFLTTLLGVLAIGNIRRSAGKLYGMPLAVFDALLFPLLLLDVLLLGVGFKLLIFVFPPELAMFLSVVLIVPVLILDVWLIRLAWRAANRDLPGSDLQNDLPPRKEPPPFQAEGTKQTSLVLVVVLLVLALLTLPALVAGGVLTVYFFSKSEPAPQAIPAIPDHSHKPDETSETIGPAH